MNKEPRKAIMTRTCLLSKPRKFNCQENQFAYKRQRNYCFKLLKISKKDFCNNLNVKKAPYSKYFWKTVQPNFTDKTLKNEKIILVEDDKVVTPETHLAKILKDHFESLAESLHIERPCKSNLYRDPVVSTIKNCSQHLSILKIKENTNSTACFSFHKVSKDDLLNQLNSLGSTKATQCDIPTNIIKANNDIFSEFFFSLQTLMTLF